MRRSLRTGEEVFIVAGCRPWSRHAFEEIIRYFRGCWHFAGAPEVLTREWIDSLDPRYIFFLHWSWLVPRELVDRYECVGFHMTDLPFGRGGTPLQNLIIRGQKSTKLTAFRLTEELDAGPVYLKSPLTLEGSAQQVYERASLLAAGMIKRMVEENPAPIPQTGEPTVFKRRSPSESEIPEMGGPEALFDFIRMLDAEGYPRAFTVHRGYRYNFFGAEIAEGKLHARVEIVRHSPKE